MGALGQRRRKNIKQPAHILTLRQIKELGQLLKLNLASAMETFMQPASLFLQTKPALKKIHGYLLEQSLTAVKVPGSLKQPDHARLLLSIIYPGYPVSKAQDLACQKERERSSNKKASDLFAYDLLPSTEFIDRGDEIYRVRLPPTEAFVQKYTIDGQKLAKALGTAAVSAKQSPPRHLFMYLWMSPRRSLTPRCSSLLIQGKETWSHQDDETIDKGFKHIDITDKYDWQSIKSKTDVTIEFALDEDVVGARAQFVSIAYVSKKSSFDLLCQLYIQTAAKLMSDALSNSATLDTTQQEATRLFNQCPPESRGNLVLVESLFLDTGRLFYTSEAMNDDNDDIVCGKEYISLMDPIMLTKIQHPCKSIFCRHRSCFDAKLYFELMTQQQDWACPICHIRLRGSQDLYIDYPLKRMITSHPNEDRFVIDDQGQYLTETQCQGDTPPPSQLPPAPIVIKNDTVLTKDP
ncbi:hypothetical protein BC940DRAFT_337539 [Gongronella butleri]|nr:hypothetical protein BC940DRAFT_337539 [Gongronella butleri]